MKKIVHITMSGSYGGAECVIFSIIDSLKNKFDFSYISPKGDVKKLVEKRNLTFIEFKLSKVRKILKKEKPYLIHAHDFSASFFTAIFSYKKNIISHIHTDHKWLKKISLKSILYLLVSFKFKKIIIVSESMAQEMWFYKFVKRKVVILINPIDSKSIKVLSNEYDVNSNYDIGFVGRLSDYKDPIRFLKILKMIKMIKPDIKAFMAGEGELRESCNKEIELNNLNENVDMKGFLENPFPYIKNTKLLVVPSKVEALGLAAGESMILGTPVICSNVGGLKDFINKENGVICNSDDDFISSILELLNDDSQRKQLSNEAKKVEKYFNFNDYIQKIEGIYNE